MDLPAQSEIPAEITKAPRRHLTYAEKVAVADCLRLHCKRDERGFAVYEDGWDDDRVKAEAVPNFAGPPGGASDGARRQLVGKLDRGAEIPDGETRLAALEDRVGALERLVSALQTRVLGEA